MKRYRLKKQFKGFKRGTVFYLVAESEFIGVKEFVFRTLDLSTRLATTEKELNTYFMLVHSFDEKEKNSFPPV